MMNVGILGRFNNGRPPSARAGMRAMAMAAAWVALIAVFSTSWPTVALAGDGTCGEASAEGSTTWYFAEGYTGQGFREYLTLFNPQETGSQIDLELLYNDGSPRAVKADLQPLSRITLDINSYAGPDREVSLRLRSTLPVVAERPMYFTYRGAWKGCTVSSGTEALYKKWYFAEGCTRRGFETWVLISNPGDAGTVATVYLILEDGGVKPVEVVLPPRSRRTVFANAAVGEGRDVCIKVEAEAPVCAERVMYFDYHGKWPGGHASSGLSRPRSTFLFAEGYTGAGFEEWLTLYAPLETAGGDGSDVTLDCLFRGGEERSFQVHLDPDRRHTVNINQLVGADKEVSMQLRADEPFLAERPMYFNYKGVCRGGHVSKGVEDAGTRWYLAEGTTRPGFDTYLCLMNPGHEAARVKVGHYYPQGLAHTDEITLPARSRMTREIHTLMPGGFPDVSFQIVSEQPIVVERPLYYPSTGFEVANAIDHIRVLSAGIGPRVAGTEKDREAADYLENTLKGYGYQTERQVVSLPDGSATYNVIARCYPDNPSVGKILVVGAHYDTKIGTGSPGANDNASGTAVVLELARCFAEMPAREKLTFVLFGGEERLVEGTDLHHFGSRHYVHSLSPEEGEEHAGAVIVDMVGVGSQLYARTMGVGPMDLCNRLLAYAKGVGVYLPYQVSGSFSDHEPFEKAGIPAVWLEVKDDPWYHTPRDSCDKIVPAHIDNTGRLLEGFIRSL